VFFFFFQAEDGIRDRNVTGVQTCALPISIRPIRTNMLFMFVTMKYKEKQAIPVITAINKKNITFLRVMFFVVASTSMKTLLFMCVIVVMSKSVIYYNYVFRLMHQEQNQSVQ